ncbi:hypothetical protein BN10_1180002 [Phycicoccus elongatus Lp2]|uniref:SWIM-type domain-containing protein n=1 Tax=Phycicoccus elongatus Lp2 TaxID=1193181 RepID=N0DXV8_9MICO|nr:hypothetical protein BN10_1180002 [Phycicoccus elongatus Lp2]
MPRRPSRWGSVRVLSARTSAPAQGLTTAEGPLDGADDDDELSWAARCSCPVRADCKHAVATLVALRDAAGAPPAPTCRT